MISSPTEQEEYVGENAIKRGVEDVAPYYVVSIKILHIHNILYETQKALAIHNSRRSGRLPCVKGAVSEAG